MDGHPLAEADILAAHQHYMAGTSYDELAELFECNRGSFLRAFKRLGLPLCGRCNRKRPRASRYTIRDDEPYALYMRYLLQ